MIIENQEVVLVEETSDFAFPLMGGVWIDFKQSIPEVQATLLTRAFNLIIMTAPPADEDDILDEDACDQVDTPELLLPAYLSQTLQDPTIGIAEKKHIAYQLITSNIIDQLVKIGFVLDDDEIGDVVLGPLCDLLSLIYDLDQYDDLIGLGSLLDSTDIPPKERLILLMETYYGQGFDTDVYERMVIDVSEVTLKAIRDSLLGEDLSEGIPGPLIKRVLDNKALLENTLAFTHIRNNGQLGGSVESFMAFFSSQLQPLLNDPSESSQFQYGKEVVALYMISEVNAPRIKELVVPYLAEIITDYAAFIRIETLINQLDLS